MKLQTVLVLRAARASIRSRSHPPQGYHQHPFFLLRTKTTTTTTTNGSATGRAASPRATTSLLERVQRSVAAAAARWSSEPATAKSGEDAKPAAEPRLEMRRLLSVAQGERGLIGFAMAAQLVAASSTMIFPLAMGRIVDSVTGASSADLNALTALTGTVFAVSALATATRTSAMSLAGSRIARYLRVAMFSAVLRQDTTFFDLRQSGELTNRLSADVSLVSRTLTDNLAKILRSGVTAGASLGLIVYLSPKLSLVTLCSLPPIGLFALMFGRNARKLSRKLVDALAAATQVAAERTAAVRTVRVHGGEAAETQRYAQRVDDTYSLAKQVAMADGIYSGSVQLAAQMSLLAVLWLGGNMVQDVTNPMTIGSLTSFSMYAVNLAVSVAGMGTAYGQLTRALGAGHRIFEVVDKVPDGPASTIASEEQTGIELPTGYDATVRFDNVSFTYPTRPEAPVLSGVSLTLRPGDVIAIAGSSGSGKSTVSTLLSRLYEPDSGNITLGGEKLSSLDLAWLRRQVAVVSQEPTLFSGTVADNISYALPKTLSPQDLEAAGRASASHDMFTSLPDGYDTSVGERGSSLSGGQRARTALARALARRPRVLVLDEHAAALDAESERAVSEAVAAAAERDGLAVLMIAHRTSSLRRAHRVAVLVDGRIAELDSYANLMSRDSYLRRMLVPPT